MWGGDGVDDIHTNVESPGCPMWPLARGVKDEAGLERCATPFWGQFGVKNWLHSPLCHHRLLTVTQLRVQVS